jgi:hypothetical protein
MSGRRSDPHLERFWRDTLAAWEKSQLSVQTFCDQRKLSVASFYGWRRTLRERDRRQPSGSQAPTFVPLQIVPEAVIEVVLATGLVVRVPHGADAGRAAALVAALRTATC